MTLTFTMTLQFENQITFDFQAEKIFGKKLQKLAIHYCLKAELEGISGAQLLNSKFG